MRRIIFFTVLFVIVASVSAFAIGGGRKGLTIGCSLGYAPIISWDRTTNGGGGPSTGPATSLMLGYGIDDKNTLVFEGMTAHTTGGNSLLMNFSGLRWYAYGRPTAPSSFFACGIGWSSLFSSSEAAVFNVIVGHTVNFPAATIGFGYEMAKRQFVGLYINAGRHENFTLVNASIMYTLMAY